MRFRTVMLLAAALMPAAAVLLLRSQSTDRRSVRGGAAAPDAAGVAAGSLAARGAVRLVQVLPHQTIFRHSGVRCKRTDGNSNLGPASFP